LEKEKRSLEEQLRSFAKKDRFLKDDWDTKFPRFSPSHSLEEEADEVEEYGNLLPVEGALETRLREVNLALGRMAQGNYGQCQKCGQQISAERLLASPEAKFCDKCKR
jgi:RNA polymerase-binding transcription factor DksA